jgi:hypothetical protein
MPRQERFKCDKCSSVEDVDWLKGEDWGREK